jgi:hypothetical protein
MVEPEERGERDMAREFLRDLSTIRRKKKSLRKKKTFQTVVLSQGQTFGGSYAPTITVVSVARGLNFITVEYTKTRTAKALAGCIKHIMDLYNRGGFQVGTVLMDNEFESLRNLILILSINTTAAKEHVPDVERRVRLIKERGRSSTHSPSRNSPRCWPCN